MFVSRLPGETSVNPAIFQVNPSVKIFYFLPTVSKLYLNVPLNAIGIFCKLLQVSKLPIHNPNPLFMKRL